MLRARGITVEAAGVSILRGVDFTAAPGAVTAIVGPNGSGKTTLLRALTGEIAATGAVTLDGLAVHAGNAVALASRRAVLPQATHLAFPFKVIEVVRIGHLAGPHAARPGVPAQALEMVDMGHMAQRFYQDLSGGEQQRVQLARVLAQVWTPAGRGGANWLFLDEPVSSLDIGHQLGVMQLAANFAAKGGGVVTVMHDLNLTAMFAQEVCMLKQGTVAATGGVHDVLTTEVLADVYDCALQVSRPPVAGMPYVLPQSVRGGMAP